MDLPYARTRPATPPETPASRPVKPKDAASQRELERAKAIVARWSLD